MTDFAVCGDMQCPSRMDCRRFMQKPGLRQRYIRFDRFGGVRCEYFVHYTKEKESGAGKQEPPRRAR